MINSVGDTILIDSNRVGDTLLIYYKYHVPFLLNVFIDYLFIGNTI